MCGDLDDDVQINAEIERRISIIARHVGVETPETPTDPGALAEDAGRASYMEAVFKGGLARTLADVEGAAETEKIDVIASAAIALARLSGFLAAQLPPDADLYRSVIEAVGDGHAEVRQITARLRALMEDHHHHHGEGHDHDHGHHHGHDHHHAHGHPHDHDH